MACLIARASSERFCLRRSAYHWISSTSRSSTIAGVHPKPEPPCSVYPRVKTNSRQVSGSTVGRSPGYASPASSFETGAASGTPCRKGAPPPGGLRIPSR